MTLAFYCNPGFPVIITDCLVTYDGAVGTALSPSDFEKLDESNPKPLARLWNKSLVLDDRTAVAFSGDGSAVTRFARKFPSMFANRPSSERPMEFVGRIVDELNRSPVTGRISVVGSSLVDIEGDSGVQTVSNFMGPVGREYNFDTEALGQCFLIGSGSERFRKVLRQFQRYRSERANSWAATKRIDYLIGFLGALNGSLAYTNEPDDHAGTWGGYLQTICNLPPYGRWLRPPPWAHLSYKLISVDPLDIVQHEKIVLYEPDKDSLSQASIMVYLLRTDSPHVVATWEIMDPFDTNRKSMNFNWEIFKPDNLTISIKVPLKTGGRMVHKTLVSPSETIFKFNINDGLITYILSHDVIRSFVNELNITNDDLIKYT